jgi:hypothetical protein
MALMPLFHGARITQLLYVAAKLGIADLLSEGAKRSEELAQAVGAHPRTLYRVLRALASLGIFAEELDRRFRLTPMADLLRTDAPASLRPFAVLSGEEWVWRAEGALLDSVRTGQAAFNQVHGMGAFDYYGQHAEAAACFQAAMTSLSGPEVQAILAAYDFAGMATIIAMATHSRLLVMERVLPAGSTPSLGPLDDITMLVRYGALERTEAAYRVLLNAAGFRLERVMPTQTALSIMEGRPA